MKIQGRPIKFMLSIICCFLLYCLSPAFSAENIIKIKVSNGSAKIVRLRGKATVIKTGQHTEQPLKKGAQISIGDRVTVKKRSRMAIKVPDNSILRFNQLSTFELTQAETNKAANTRSVKLKMVSGKTWAKVAKTFQKGSFEISTKTAVCGVRGTTYRMNVNSDDSVNVRVYGGKVAVSGKPQNNITYSQPQSTASDSVNGPQPVKGPKPVSLEEWTYIVSKLQEININPNGMAEKPINFDFTQDAQLDWVKWNKELDAELNMNQQ